MKGGVCLILSFGGGFQNVRVKDRRIKELERPQQEILEGIPKGVYVRHYSCTYSIKLWGICLYSHR